jgi:hypothetical protein
MTGDGLSRPVFQLCDAAQDGPEQEVLDLWTPVPGRSLEAMAFDAPAGATAESEPIWRADYPAEPDLIEKHLNEARKSLDAADVAVAVAPARLDAFVSQGQAGVAFAVPGLDARSAEPEGELSLLLGELRGDGLMVSFDPNDPHAGKLDQAVQSFQAFTDRLNRMIGHLAWVETRVEGRLVGRTAVSWTGDVDTRVLEQLEAERVRLHHQTLELALASRRTMLRTSSLVISSAVKLSVLLATPGGIVLALPAVLRFIRLLRKELKSSTKNERGG